MSEENEINPLTPIPAEHVAGEVLNRTAHLLHSTHLQSKTFTRPLPDGGGELAEIIIGEPSKGENPHVLLSTHGLGGQETTASINFAIDGAAPVDYVYHAEFFTVADNETTANLLAEELARLAYFVVDSKQGVVPGSIIQLDDEQKSSYLFSPNPLGIEEGHKEYPVLTEERFAVFHTAVTKLYPEEVPLLREPGGLDRFVAFLTELKSEAYSYTRPMFTVEAEPEAVADETPDTEV